MCRVQWVFIYVYVLYAKRIVCFKNATGFDGKRSKLHWHLKQASLAHEAYFIFLGNFLGKDTKIF